MSIDPSNGFHVLLVAVGCIAGTALLCYGFLRFTAWELRNAISPFVLWPEGPGKTEA